MKKSITVAYIVSIHFLLAIVLFKSDFIDRVQAKLGINQEDANSEITDHFRRMRRFHTRMDGNVPDGAFVFIGDSITQGLYVSAVVSPAVNYGISMDTTVGVLQRLADYKSIDRAKAVVLAIGINDMWRRPNKEILRNYRSIIQQIPNTTPIFLSAVLPLDEESWDAWQGKNQGQINNFNTSIEMLANANNRIFFIDAGSLLIDASGNLADKYHVGDGIHLNTAGNAVWIEALRNGIEEAHQSFFFNNN